VRQWRKHPRDGQAPVRSQKTSRVHDFGIARVKGLTGVLPNRTTKKPPEAQSGMFPGIRSYLFGLFHMRHVGSVIPGGPPMGISGPFACPIQTAPLPVISIAYHCCQFDGAFAGAKTIEDFATIWLVRHFVGWLIGPFQSREDLVLESLALRQRLLTLLAKRPRPRLVNRREQGIVRLSITLPTAASPRRTDR
jgi:hypothetical protein